MKPSRLNAGLTFLTRAACLGVLAIASISASADIYHTGKITIFHLNGQDSSRGLCVQMNPPVPGTGWACLWKTNPLYKEITAMLMTGHVAAKTCRVAWTADPVAGHPAIVWAECY